MATNLNFVNSVMTDVKLKLQDIFPLRAGITNIANQSKGEALRAILGRQQIQTIPVYENGKCVATRVVFLKDCDATQSGCFDFTAAANSGCDLPAGNKLTSEVFKVDDDCHIVRYCEVDDNLCDNLYTATDLVATQLKNAMEKIVTEANQKLYKDLIAKRMPNKFPRHIASSWTDGVQLTTDVPDAFWTADFMVQSGLAANYNGLENYLILDGGNLITQRALSQYHGLNANEKHQPAIFGDYPIVFDNLRDIVSATGGRNSTFFVDTTGVGVLTRFFNVSNSPQNLTDPQHNRYEYHLPLAGIPGAMVDVVYQKICTGQNKNGVFTYSHRFRLTFSMTTVFAPNGCNNETGVLEFVNV